MESGERARRRSTVKARALEWLKSRGAARIDEALAAEALAGVEGLTAKALRAVLMESGIEMAPLVEGVRQDTFEHMERTLLALEREYEAGDRPRRKKVRQTVITARQHGEWAARSSRADESKRRTKEEMVLWMRTWLENPPLFPAWVRLRRRAACLEPPDAM